MGEDDLRSVISRLTVEKMVEQKRAEIEQNNHQYTKEMLRHCRAVNEALLLEKSHFWQFMDEQEQKFKKQILSQAEKLAEKEREIDTLKKKKKKSITVVKQKELHYNSFISYLKQREMAKLKELTAGFISWFDTLPDMIQILTYGAIGTALTLLAEDIKNGQIQWGKYWVILTAYLSNVVLYEAKKFLAKKTS